MRLFQLFGLYDGAVKEAIHSLPLRDRFPAWRFLRENRRENLWAACKEFASENGGPTFTDEDTTTDRPFLEFLKWLIESGKIQPFIQFMMGIIKDIIAMFSSRSFQESAEELMAAAGLAKEPT